MKKYHSLISFELAKYKTTNKTWYLFLLQWKIGKMTVYIWTILTVWLLKNRC